MQDSLAIRSYTVNEFTPIISQLADGVFRPQAVPAYSVTQISNIVRKARPEYIYKEAVNNPINPRDLADAWEKEIIEKFI